VCFHFRSKPPLSQPPVKPRSASATRFHPRKNKFALNHDWLNGGSVECAWLLVYIRPATSLACVDGCITLLAGLLTNDNFASPPYYSLSTTFERLRLDFPDAFIKRQDDENTIPTTAICRIIGIGSQLYVVKTAFSIMGLPLKDLGALSQAGEAIYCSFQNISPTSSCTITHSPPSGCMVSIQVSCAVTIAKVFQWLSPREKKPVAY
jgi:hypothetical protein